MANLVGTTQFLVASAPLLYGDIGDEPSQDIPPTLPVTNRSSNVTTVRQRTESTAVNRHNMRSQVIYFTQGATKCA